MHIILTFLRGERYPEGRLDRDQQHVYLTQTIEFIFENQKTFDLLEVDARSFFIVISELFMNKNTCNFLKDLNDDEIFNITHEIIIEKFKEIVNSYASVKHLKFEYSYWIIKIANCEMYKSDPQKIISQVYESIIFVLFEIYDFNEKKKAANFELKPEDKFSGPNDITLPDIEQEILDLLPHYSKYMEYEELNEIIEISQKLLIDKIRIYIYEDQKDFEQCIQTFLTSYGCETQDVFIWLHTLYTKKKDILEEESITRIQNEIMKVIQDFIIADSVKTSQVIDDWLPNQQIEIIDKLGSNQELQLKYLSDFINEREEEISEVMKSAGKIQSPHLNDYKYFLKLHIKLLAKYDCRRISIKDYYPIDCLDDIDDGNVLIREARAFLYKRCGDIDNSLTIFLGLLEEISYDEIKHDGFQTKDDDSKFTLSFSKIFTEICQLLVRWTSIPGYKDKIWYQVLRTLFKIKKKYFVDVETSRTKAVNLILLNKISDYLQLMSKYIEFGNVIKLLLEVDEKATFRYSKKWFQSLFVSKADQEFLYKSAQKLLSNENSAMVDNMVDKYQHGFKGTKNQTCDLCKGILVNPYFERALIF